MVRTASGLEPVENQEAESKARGLKVGTELVWQSKPCASPASRLQRPGGSERDALGEINVCCTDALPALSSKPMAREAAEKK